jgi:hypothetical protein
MSPHMPRTHRHEKTPAATENQQKEEAQERRIPVLSF